MYCSVKFLEPTVIVGPPPPLSSPALGPEPLLLPTLPQPARASSARVASSAGMARISFVLFFTVPPLPLCLTSALLRDLQPLGGHSLLQRAEADLRDDGQDRNREGAGEQYGRVVELGALHDQFPKTAAPNERRQGCARDHLHRGGADAGEDHRGGYRELYAGEHLAPRESHPACRVYDVSAHLPQARRRIDEDGGYRQGGQRYERRVEAEAEEGLAERQDGERWDGAPDVADVDGQRRAQVGVPYRERHGQRDSDADEQGGQGEEDVLPEQLEEVGASEDIEYPGHPMSSSCAPRASGSAPSRGARGRR